MGGMRMGGANAAFANRGAFSRGGMPGGFGGGGMRGGGGFGGGRGGGGFGGGGRGGFGGGRARWRRAWRRRGVAPTCASSMTSYCSGGSTTVSAIIASSTTAATPTYVGVMAQEVRTVMPEAVTRGPDGYMRVSYDRLGLPFETYDQWVASGAHLPSVKPAAH